MLVLQIPCVYYYEPGRSKRLKGIMLVHQIPCIYYYRPGDQSDGGTLCWLL